MHRLFLGSKDEDLAFDWIDKPSKLCAVLAIDLHLGPNFLQPIRWRPQLNHKIRTEGQKFDRVIELLRTGKKDVSSEYIETEFGIPTEEVINNVQITDTIRNFYSEPEA